MKATASKGSLRALQLPVQAQLEALDCYLNNQAAACEPQVQSLVAGALAHSGKRLRSLLVFYAGYPKEGEAYKADLIRIAGILELVHLATLVHDDILDGALIRHHAPTVHAQYGPHAAVLLGDVLFAHALTAASEFPTTLVCKNVARATRRVCSGELAQTFDRAQQAMTLESYFSVIDLKTAELFSVAAHLGAYFADLGDQWTQAAAVAGRHLGMAYQILDDWWDLTADAEKLGKTLGTDFSSGKMTLPLILLARDQPNWRELSPNEYAEAFAQLRINERTHEWFKRHLTSAQEALAPHASIPGWGLLCGLSAWMETLWK